MSHQQGPAHCSELTPLFCFQCKNSQLIYLCIFLTSHQWTLSITNPDTDTTAKSMNDFYQQSTLTAAELWQNACFPWLLPLGPRLALEACSAWSIFGVFKHCDCRFQLWPPFLANQSGDVAKIGNYSSFWVSKSVFFPVSDWLGQLHLSVSVDRKYVLRILVFRMFFSHFGDLMWHRKY